MGGFFRILKKIKLWQWFLIFVAVAFLFVTLLRINHLQMNQLKEAVLAADESDNEEETLSALNRLKDFTENHMIVNISEKNGVNLISFGSGPIYLERLYVKRATEAIERAQAEAGDDSNPNGNVFAKAMNVCKPQAITYGWSWNSQPYIDCMLGEIAKYPASDFIQDGKAVNLPSTNLFRYDFISPIWNFSLTGIIGVVCVILLGVIITKILIYLIIKVATFLMKSKVTP